MPLGWRRTEDKDVVIAGWGAAASILRGAIAERTGVLQRLQTRRAKLIGVPAIRPAQVIGPTAAVIQVGAEQLFGD